jgi:hypothetical protein
MYGAQAGERAVVLSFCINVTAQALALQTWYHNAGGLKSRVLQNEAVFIPQGCLFTAPMESGSNGQFVMATTLVSYF